MAGLKKNGSSSSSTLKKPRKIPVKKSKILKKNRSLSENEKKTNEDFDRDDVFNDLDMPIEEAYLSQEDTEASEGEEIDPDDRLINAISPDIIPETKDKCSSLPGSFSNFYDSHIPPDTKSQYLSAGKIFRSGGKPSSFRLATANNDVDILLKKNNDVDLINDSIYEDDNEICKVYSSQNIESVSSSKTNCDTTNSKNNISDNLLPNVEFIVAIKEDSNSDIKQVISSGLNHSKSSESSVENDENQFNLDHKQFEEISTSVPVPTQSSISTLSQIPINESNSNNMDLVNEKSDLEIEAINKKILEKEINEKIIDLRKGWCQEKANITFGELWIMVSF